MEMNSELMKAMGKLNQALSNLWCKPAWKIAAEIFTEEENDIEKKLAEAVKLTGA